MQLKPENPKSPSKPISKSGFLTKLQKNQDKIDKLTKPIGKNTQKSSVKLPKLKSKKNKVICKFVYMHILTDIDIAQNRVSKLNPYNERNRAIKSLSPINLNTFSGVVPQGKFRSPERQRFTIKNYQALFLPGVKKVKGSY